MNFETFEKELLKNDKFAKEYYRKDDLAFDISEVIINARIRKGMTQKKLAEKVGTKQSSIARLESGNFLPSIKFLQKIANALNAWMPCPILMLKKSCFSAKGSGTMIATAQIN